MTIEGTEPRRSPLGGPARRTTIVLAIIVGWFASASGIMLFSEAAPAALVIVRGDSFLKNLPENVRIVRGGEHSMVLTSDDPGYVKDLYRAGAWFVLPARKSGCIDLRAIARLTGLGDVET